MEISEHAALMPTHHEILKHGSLDNYSNYAGDIVPDTHVFVYSKNRDSEGIEICNFKSIQNTLESMPDISENEDSEYSTVYIHSINHWACGYVDYLFVRKDTPQHLRAAELLISLENYGILDDELYSAHVCNECNQYFDNEINGLCDSCQENLLEKSFGEYLEEIVDRENLFLLVYDKNNNTFIAENDFDYYIDEIKEAIQESAFFEVLIRDKSLFDSTFLTFAKTEKEALNDIDIFLSGDYFTAKTNLITLNKE